MNETEIHPVAQYVFSFIKMKKTTEYQLSKAGDFSHVTFNNWRKGKVPSTKILEKIQKVHPDFNRNGYTNERSNNIEFSSVPYLASEQEKELIFWKQKTYELEQELIQKDILIGKIEKEKNALFNILEKFK